MGELVELNAGNARQQQALAGRRATERAETLRQIDWRSHPAR